MDFRDNAEEAGFRKEVRDFVVANLPKGFGTPDSPLSPQEETAYRDTWAKTLAPRHWVAPHWPREYGGAGLTTVEQFIFNEEMGRYRAPTGIGGSGLQMIGPTLLLYGNDEQKQRFLPPIASGEVYWCQGYTEPGSGSDLASLQTRAIRDGDEYVINGQKIFTSFAHYAQWMFMLARTDPDAPKHRGISMFLLDMKTPGITVTPLIDMSDDHYFNQVFFDNVRVPAKNMVGEENRGWYVGATLLDFERSNIRQSLDLQHMVADITQFARENRGANQGLISDLPAIRIELADRAVEAEVSRLFSCRVATMQRAGQVPNYESSMGKVWRTETQQRISRTGMKVVGQYGNLARGSKWAPLQGKLAWYYLNSVNATIGAGTSEIQRNIIAGRGLGLPRD